MLCLTLPPRSLLLTHSLFRLPWHFVERAEKDYFSINYRHRGDGFSWFNESNTHYWEVSSFSFFVFVFPYFFNLRWMFFWMWQYQSFLSPQVITFVTWFMFPWYFIIFTARINIFLVEFNFFHTHNWTDLQSQRKIWISWKLFVSLIKKPENLTREIIVCDLTNLFIGKLAKWCNFTKKILIAMCYIIIYFVLLQNSQVY